MDNITKQWLNGINNFEISGYILDEKEYLSPVWIKMIMNEMERKGIKFATDEERRNFLNIFSSQIISNWNKKREG